MLKAIIYFLLLANFSIWFFVATYPDDKVHIIACDVGQGDGILIYYKTTQVIIDGGPGNKMVNCLDKHIPFWDHTIELVINTHPQADHYEGLLEVLSRYNVQVFTANSLKASASAYQLLQDLVGREGSRVVNPNRGTRFVQDQLALEILHPSTEWAQANSESDRTSDLDPNTFSIIAKLQYKSFDALFTGDANEEVEDLLQDQSLLSDIEYLKVPHHGSKNGLTSELLKATTPEIAVISNGKKNSYGHPHKEVLDMLEAAKVKILRTDLSGDVEVISDGEKYWIKI
jgi:competence protein ComEC